MAVHVLDLGQSVVLVYFKHAGWLEAVGGLSLANEDGVSGVHTVEFPWPTPRISTWNKLSLGRPSGSPVEHTSPKRDSADCKKNWNFPIAYCPRHTFEGLCNGGMFFTSRNSGLLRPPDVWHLSDWNGCWLFYWAIISAWQSDMEKSATTTQMMTWMVERRNFVRWWRWCRDETIDTGWAKVEPESGGAKKNVSPIPLESVIHTCKGIWFHFVMEVASTDNSHSLHTTMERNLCTATNKRDCHCNCRPPPPGFPQVKHLLDWFGLLSYLMFLWFWI